MAKMKVATLERLGEFLTECKALFASQTDVAEVNGKTVDKINQFDLQSSVEDLEYNENSGVYWCAEAEVECNDTYYYQMFRNKVPIVAGENVTFEQSTVPATNAPVVKINVASGLPPYNTSNNGQFLGVATWTSAPTATIDYNSDTQTLSITTD